MTKRNIMICLVRLGIGGVETHVYNQTKELISRGYNVVILAKSGIYTNKFLELGARCVYFEYVYTEGYDLKQAKRIENVIKEYEIDEVYIHQVDCIPALFPACVNTNTPYVAFIHTGIKGTYDWFEEHLTGYDKMFKLYFEKAQKIVAITEEAIEENKTKYNISEDKYIIKHNSIDFSDINVDNIPNKIQNFIIVSRLAVEKDIPIKNSIDIFKGYLKENKDAYLTIVGDGDEEIRTKVKQEIEEIKENCKMLGARNDVLELIKQNDVVLGVDRCILEATASKRIAIVCSYEGKNNIILPENIKKAVDSNFSGRNLESKEISEIVEFLKSLDEEKIKDIVNKNYEFVYENLNIKTNLYVLDKDNIKLDYTIDKDFYFEVVNSITPKVEAERWNSYEIYTIKQENEEKFMKTIEDLRLENIEKTNLLNSIYNSRRWKYVENVKKVINKFRGKSKQKN